MEYLVLVISILIMPLLIRDVFYSWKNPKKLIKVTRERQRKVLGIIPMPARLYDENQYLWSVKFIGPLAILVFIFVIISVIIQIF